MKNIKKDDKTVRKNERSTHTRNDVRKIWICNVCCSTGQISIVWRNHIAEDEAQHHKNHKCSPVNQVTLLPPSLRVLKGSKLLPILPERFLFHFGFLLSLIWSSFVTICKANSCGANGFCKNSVWNSVKCPNSSREETESVGSVASVDETILSELK